MNIELLIKDLTLIKEETLDAGTRCDLDEVVRGLLNSESDYFR